MIDKNCDDEYARLWQMYGELEDERDRLREALEYVLDTSPDRLYEQKLAQESYSEALRIARTALQESGE